MAILTNQLGLGIAEDKVQLVEIINKDRKITLENVDEEYFEETINSNTKESKFIHILQNAFNEIILRKPLQSSKISISLPPTIFKVFELPTDKNLTKNDLNDYINWELAKLFPGEKKNHYTFRKIVLDPVNYMSFSRVLVFALPLSILQRIHKFCIRNNMQLRFVDHAHVATSGFIMREPSEKNTMSIFIENFHISILLFFNNGLIFEGNTSYKSINEVAEKINNIKTEISKRNLIKQDIENVYLLGSSITAELKNNIEKLFISQVKEIYPFENLDIKTELDDNHFVNELSSRFSPAAAVALRI